MNAAKKKSWFSIADDNVISFRSSAEPIPPSPIEMDRLQKLRKLEIERGVLHDHDNETLQLEAQYEELKRQRAIERDHQVNVVNELNRECMDMVNRLGEPTSLEEQ